MTFAPQRVAGPPFAVPIQVLRPPQGIEALESFREMREVYVICKKYRSKYVKYVLYRSMKEFILISFSFRF